MEPCVLSSSVLSRESFSLPLPRPPLVHTLCSLPGTCTLYRHTRTQIKPLKSRNEEQDSNSQPPDGGSPASLNVRAGCLRCVPFVGVSGKGSSWLSFGASAPPGGFNTLGSMSSSNCGVPRGRGQLTAGPRTPPPAAVTSSLHGDTLHPAPYTPLLTPKCSTLTPCS